jgi:hypothetical protein
MPTYAASASATDFIVRGATVPAADTIFLTLGLTANATTVFAANTGNANISFAIFGSEIT